MKQQFAVGDKAVYPVHGVAEVVALEQRDIGGSKTPVYILKIIDTGMKIMVPTINAGTVGLRDLITSKQVKEVYSILKSRDIPRDTQTWNRRYREYMEKIKTGACSRSPRSCAICASCARPRSCRSASARCSRRRAAC